MGYMSGGGFGVGWKHHHHTHKHKDKDKDKKHNDPKPAIQQTQQIPQEPRNNEQWDSITDKFINKIETDDFKQYINNLFNNLVDVYDYGCLKFIVTFGFKKDKIYFNMCADENYVKPGVKLSYKLHYYFNCKKLNVTTASDIIYTIQDYVCETIREINPSYYVDDKYIPDIKSSIKSDKKGWFPIYIHKE